MALEAHQRIIAEDINFKVATATERGKVLSYSSTAGFVEASADATGKRPAGVLLLDVVAKDFGAQPVNHQKLETGLSGVVRLLRVGECETNQIATGSSYAAGDKIYLGNNGTITTDPTNQLLGTALGAKSSTNYLRVWINLT